MMDKSTSQPKRCAVYTRKSTDKGLEQDYNSIDAQRDACKMYIASQQSEGWVLVDRDYDDPAYSGGTLERPALQQLLADISSGLIDTVVVYKIDRLTRSLIDFAKLVEQFDPYGVSFVAVTQQFNTSHSMGRLTLNMLLSFAQFEREISSERIRDKIAASKKKGLWMGGVPPLGYDVKDRQLIINPQEAQLIQRIFQHVANHGSITELVAQLRAESHTSKAWVTQSGEHRPGKPIDKGMVYKWLHNRTYLGEIHHKDQWYPGKHEAIIDQPCWDKVHEILKQRCPKRTPVPSTPFLLQGLLFGDDQRALTTYSAVSKNSSGAKRYRYYTSTRDTKEYAGASGLPRLPAGELEALVVRCLRGVLRSPSMMTKVAQATQHTDDPLDEAQVTVAMTRIETIWEQLFIDEQRRILHCLVEKIVVSPTQITIELKPSGIGELVLEVGGSANDNSSDPTSSDQQDKPYQHQTIATVDALRVIEISDGRILLAVPITFRRRSGRHRIIVPDNAEAAQTSLAADQPTSSLQRALIRAHRWLAQLNSRQAPSIKVIAEKENVDNSYVSRIIHLTTLAPDIVSAILDDQVPSTLALEQLVSNPPWSWEEQRKRFGFEVVG